VRLIVEILRYITGGTLLCSSINGDIAFLWEWSKFDNFKVILLCTVCPL